MKILLANPPWLPEGRFGIRAGCRWPFTVERPPKGKTPDYLPYPFFLGYTSALLKRDTEAEIIFIDAIAEAWSAPEYLEKVRELAPDLVVHETSTPSFDYDLDLAQKVKEQTNCLLALCGPHATVFGTQILEQYDFVDLVLKGEYDFTARELVQKLSSGKNLEGVKGLIYRKNGSFVENPARELIENLDELPWPDRDSVPVLRYQDAFAGMPQPSVQIWATRGCPYGCIYCLWPKVMYGGSNYRVRNVTDVCDEIEYLLANYPFKSFYLDDDTFNIGKKRLLEFAENLKHRKIAMKPWAGMARADTFDAETLAALKEAGLYSIKYGVESGDQNLIKESGKRLDLKKVEEMVKITKSLGIKTHLTFTFGLPGESRETIKKSVDFALSLEPDTAQFSITTPFPGTDYYALANKKGYLVIPKKSNGEPDWSKFDGEHTAVVRTEALEPEELVQEVEKANKIFKRYQIKQALLHPQLYHLVRILKKPRTVLSKIRKAFQ